MTTINSTDLSSDFEFWLPEEGYSLSIGPDQPDLAIPSVPIPIKVQDYIPGKQPGEKVLGDGIYEYLCQFPDCDHAADYAEILQQAYPFLYSDIAAQLIVLDVKGADADGTKRKLALLKILLYAEPDNFGLLFKTGVACLDLSLCYTEIYNVDSYLQQARMYFERARKLNATDPANLNYLGQVCYLLGRYHQAKVYWQLAMQNIDSQGTLERLQYFLDKIDTDNLPANSLATSLNNVASALDLYESGDHAQALGIMEALEQEGSLVKELPDPEFYYFLGICREKCHNITGARQAFEQALQLDPAHQLATAGVSRVDRN